MCGKNGRSLLKAPTTIDTSSLSGIFVRSGLAEMQVSCTSIVRTCFIGIFEGIERRCPTTGGYHLITLHVVTTVLHGVAALKGDSFISFVLRSAPLNGAQCSTSLNILAHFSKCVKHFVMDLSSTDFRSTVWAVRLSSRATVSVDSAFTKALVSVRIKTRM